MPTYEYICKNCNHTWECEHSIKEVIKKCPACDNETAKRLISSGTAFQLLGGRWGSTGYS